MSYLEGSKAAEKVIKETNPSIGLIKAQIWRIESEIDELDPDDFESQEEYDERFYWLDGYLSALEQKYLSFFGEK
jgi:hypothetical protein